MKAFSSQKEALLVGHDGQRKLNSQCQTSRKFLAKKLKGVDCGSSLPDRSSGLICNWI
jgi:hypothetical protein